VNHQKFPTSKLFYGKWPYKILCIVKESWKIKRMGVDKTIEYCYNPRNTFYANKWRGNPTDISRLLKFTTAVEPFLSKEIQVRAENSMFNIYCKDQTLYNDMVTQLDEFITEVHEPINIYELDYIVDNGAKKILCNQLPHKKYQYRVWIKPSFKPDARLNFSIWLANYQDRVLSNNSTIKWFNSQGRYWSDQPSIYIKDSATLSMVGLYLGNNLQKVEEFIPRSNINISLNQENTCQL